MFNQPDRCSDPTGAARLANLSARVLVGGVAGTPNAGVVVNGTANARVLIRAVGPALGAFGVTDRLAAPVLDLARNGSLVRSNGAWLASDAATFASVGAFALPAGSRDAALVMNLSNGNTNAMVRAVDGGNGVALLEAYDAATASETGRLSGLSMRARRDWLRGAHRWLECAGRRNTEPAAARRRTGSGSVRSR